VEIVKSVLWLKKYFDVSEGNTITKEINFEKDKKKNCNSK
jgi:hypothetical protein